MRDHDAACDPFACEQSRLLDELEPLDIGLNEYREAAGKMISFMHRVFSFIHEAHNREEVIIRLWAVTSAIEHPAINGRSDLQLAEDLGTTRANLSKHIIAFERRTSLPPTCSQKSVKARGKYRQAREAQLSNGNASHHSS